MLDIIFYTNFSINSTRNNKYIKCKRIFEPVLHFFIVWDSSSKRKLDLTVTFTTISSYQKYACWELCSTIIYLSAQQRNKNKCKRIS